MKQQINLYPYLPKVEATLLASPALIRAYLIFCGLLVLIFIGMLIRVYTHTFQLNRLEKNLSLLNKEKESAEQIALRNQTAMLSKDILYLRHLIDIKKTALQDLRLLEQSNIELMTDRFEALSRLRLPQIQLQKIILSDKSPAVVLSGLANSSGAVITLIKQLKTYAAYQSLYFSQVNVTEMTNAETPNTTALSTPDAATAPTESLLNFAIISSEIPTNANNLSPTI